jgi:hypothetical protein
MFLSILAKDLCLALQPRSNHKGAHFMSLELQPDFLLSDFTCKLLHRNDNCESGGGVNLLQLNSIDHTY